MEYCGLDLGRRSSRYCIVDNARDVVQEGDVHTHKTHLRRVFSKREPMRIVVEATTATVVIGGLVTSTLLTLLVLPAVYAWLGRKSD